jgi:allantoate deiminase
MSTSSRAAGSAADLPQRPNTYRFGEAISARIEQLARLTDEPGKLTRLYLGPAHREAAALVSRWMRDAGMVVHMDAAGTVIGRYDGLTADAPVLLVGSHIDTVPNAGRFDGTLGVLAALAAVATLNEAGKRLPFAIDVVAFGDEEGIRYPGTLTGSRALAGKFETRVLAEVDGKGISRRQALLDFGCDPEAIGSLARDPAATLGYIEVHIEQGPVLESEAHSVGVVTAINGAMRGRVTVQGEGGHAGTVPMTMRADAATAAAEMILAVERMAKAQSDLVATVGVIEVANAAVNAVPGLVAFSLDVRSASDAERLAFFERLKAEFARIAAERRATFDVALTYEAPAAQCDHALTEALAQSVGRLGLDGRRLSSGAGHDAMSFKDRIPFAMLFVRCRHGISHHPDEFTTVEDMDAAARVLADALETTIPASFAAAGRA